MPGAGRKGEIQSGELDKENPVLYVGETIRSILERTEEHWKGYEGSKDDNHMYKHQAIVHEGAPANFTTDLQIVVDLGNVVPSRISCWQ